MQILRNVLCVVYFKRHGTYRWVKFLDEISLLQTINLSKLTEKERAAFMLNLYHAMVLHGSVVIGPPAAWNTWNYFFNSITYLLSYEVVSIAEMEYNIIRYCTFQAFYIRITVTYFCVSVCLSVCVMK